MATLQTFGGGTTDFILDPGNGAKPLPNAPYTVIDGVTMLPASGLTDANGIAVTQLTSDADGRYAGSALLEGSTYWLDCVGARGPFRAGPQVSTTALANVVAMGPQLNTIAASAAASAFSAKQAQAAAEAVQTGATNTDASKLTTGTLAAARLPDLSALYGSKSAVDANTAAVAATQAQQTQLMQVAATTDEMLTTCIVSTATTGHILLAAPFALTIAQVFMTAPAAAVAADDVNYMTVELFRFRAGGTASIGLKTTKTPASGGEALVMNQPWTFDGASLTASRLQMSPLDGLRVNITKTGTAVLPLELHFTIRWVPGLG